MALAEPRGEVIDPHADTSLKQSGTAWNNQRLDFDATTHSIFSHNFQIANDWPNVGVSRAATRSD